jgi:hypothetical protein
MRERPAHLFVWDSASIRLGLQEWQPSVFSRPTVPELGHRRPNRPKAAATPLRNTFDRSEIRQHTLRLRIAIIQSASIQLIETLPASFMETGVDDSIRRHSLVRSRD